MNAHVDFRPQDQDTALHMVAARMVEAQTTGSWIDSVGGCDDCSTVPFDATAAGRNRTLVLEGDRLVMRDAAYGSILD